MSWLEDKGIEALEVQFMNLFADAVQSIKDHITQELENNMAPLNESIDRVVSAFNTELGQIRAQAEANVAAAESALAASDASNVELQAANQASLDQNTALLASIEEGSGRLDTLSADLEANDPVVEPPVDETPVEEPVELEPVDPPVDEVPVGDSEQAPVDSPPVDAPSTEPPADAPQESQMLAQRDQG